MASSKQHEQIFLTGGSGYIGSVVVEFAIAEGYKVHALSRTEQGDAKLRGLGAVPVRGDLSTLDVLRRESAAADIVLHLATGYTISTGSYDDVLPADIAAVDALAEPLVGTEKPLVVTSGTMMVAADPSGAETTEESPDDPNPFVNRVETERHGLAWAGKGVKVINIRLAPYVYGRAGSGIKLFMEFGAKGGGVTCIDGGKNRTTIVHVDDAARLYLLAMKKGKAGETFNASSATDVVARQLFETVATAAGLPLLDMPFDAAMAQLGPTFAKFISAENRASGAKAIKQLGWQPKEAGILEDIKSGSYQALAEAIRKEKGGKERVEGGAAPGL